VGISDVALNIIGYLPAGLVLGRLGIRPAIGTAALLSTVAELAQVFARYRDPSIVDLICNTCGAAAGVWLARRLSVSTVELKITRLTSVVAAACALAVLLTLYQRAAYSPNPRGSSGRGTLEAYWSFDRPEQMRSEGRSRNVLDAKPYGHPTSEEGPSGKAVRLDGVRDYLSVGRSHALTLTGSMTISAWIKPTSFPADDAAIVSAHNGVGYQFDTSVDSGPRTISLKLSNACGQLIARYGATALEVNRWYHVAGVYDADEQTIDVYVDGWRDNGYLLGPVTRRQRPSREAVYIGRRSNVSGHEFAGLIDEVRIYSRPLSEAEIRADMGRHDEEVPPARGVRSEASNATGVVPAALRDAHAEPCLGASDREDRLLPVAAAGVGMLGAIALAGAVDGAGSLAITGLGLLAGVLIGILAAPVPLTATAAAVVCSAGGALAIGVGKRSLRP
jgi:hypothetical protein